jgi:nucleoside-diphosphate-sugar epimerase
MTSITVLGAAGFIGSALVKRLKEKRLDYFAPGRNEKLPNQNLGHVIYCIGLTADFRSRPFDAVEAHVCYLLEVLRTCEFQSLLYLSSTRVYRQNSAEAREEDAVSVNSSFADDLYNISKLMGESLTLACRKKTRIARLSNVYGGDFASENFLPAIIREVISKSTVTLQGAPDGEKDYVSVGDVVDGLIRIAVEGRQNIYNLASGMNVSNRTLAKTISELTACQVAFDPAAPRITFPRVNVDRMRSEFGFRPRNILDDLGNLIESYRKHYEEQNRKG